MPGLASISSSIRASQNAGSDFTASSESGGFVVQPRMTLFAGSAVLNRRRSCASSSALQYWGAAFTILATHGSKISGELSHHTSISGLVFTNRSITLSDMCRLLSDRPYAVVLIG